MGGIVRNGECIGIVHCAHGSFFNSDQRDRNQPGRFKPESNRYFDGKPRRRGDTKSRASGSGASSPGTACSFAGLAGHYKCESDQLQPVSLDYFGEFLRPAG